VAVATLCSSLALEEGPGAGFIMDISIIATINKPFTITRSLEGVKLSSKVSLACPHLKHATRTLNGIRDKRWAKVVRESHPLAKGIFTRSNLSSKTYPTGLGP